MPTRGTKRWSVVVLMGILIMGIVGWNLFLREQRPALAQTYQGRNAEEWLYQFYRSGSMAELESNYVALAALRSESIPLLAEAAVDTYRESLMDRLKKFARDKTGLLDDSLGSESIHSTSLFALRCLQPTGPELVPLATRKYESSFLPPGKISAIVLLQFVNTDHEACIPLLKKAYASHNFDIGLAASSLILNWDLTAQPVDVLPALIDYVENTSISTASSDYEVLKRYGFAASNAVPVIRERFMKAEANDKLAMAAVLLKVDPNDEVASEFLLNIVKDTDHEYYTFARVLLLSCGPEQQRLAEPLWKHHQSLPESDFNRGHILEILVNLESPREPLLKLIREEVESAESSTEHLGLSWFILRLDPRDQNAWKNFKSRLFIRFTDANVSGEMNNLTSALGYLRIIPVADSVKIKLLDEVIAHHSGSVAHEDYARRETLREIIRIAPDRQPTDINELIELYD